MLRRLLPPILILPGNVVITIPAVLLYVFRHGRWRHDLATSAEPRFWAALLIFAAGVALAAWTMGLFARVGEGTPAPWDPPRRLVVRGPYRHVRNPMMLAVFLMLSAEALLFWSGPVLCWLGFFVLLNLIFIPVTEEPQLARRFGADYDLYRRHVRRWLPQLNGWRQPQERL